METMEERTVLNQAQLEFLQLLGHIKTKEELDELREVVCDFYARKIDEGMENLWERNLLQHIIVRVVGNNVGVKHHTVILHKHVYGLHEDPL